MSRGRLEAFSDGVIAILITIMVLELKVPEHPDWHLLFKGETGRTLLTYVLSFITLGIYWMNHHHLLHTIEKVSGSILWANLHLLFWLSLVPFTAFWMNGGDAFYPTPTAAYGVTQLGAGIAFFILVRRIIANHGPDSRLARAIGRDYKGKLSVLFYAAGVGLSFVRPWMGIALYFLVGAIWLVPDRRIERTS